MPNFTTKFVVMAPKTLLFSKNIAKIGLADPEIIVIQRSLRMIKKKKEINTGKIYSPLVRHAERTKLSRERERQRQ